jgi:uncharacterized protein
MADCCHPPRRSVDWLFQGGLWIVIGLYAVHLFDVGVPFPWLNPFAHSIFSLINKMWWGLALGILFAGMMSRIPREVVMSALGPSGRLGGIIRATLAGTLLDLCNHGILLVGMQLYRRGASLGQTMAFLISSPWNSLSLTLILAALIGWPWTIVYVLLSAVIAVVSGMIFEILVRRKVLPPNPNSVELPDGLRVFPEIKKSIKQADYSPNNLLSVLVDGLKESRMIIKWILIGSILAALIQTFVSRDTFESYMGPTLIGLGLTLLAATIIEVCSEGSTPIAAEIVNRGSAPGNGFAFLMAGAATDYTEIMSLRETTKSWKIALFLPLVTVPQITLIAYLINQAGRS